MRHIPITSRSPDAAHIVAAQYRTLLCRKREPSLFHRVLNAFALAFGAHH